VRFDPEIIEDAGDRDAPFSSGKSLQDPPPRLGTGNGGLVAKAHQLIEIAETQHRVRSGGQTEGAVGPGGTLPGVAFASHNE
jgi:hypothetical protein